MKSTNLPEICERVMGSMDSYIDGSIAADQRFEVSNHLDACPACKQEMLSRNRLRARLRSAVSSEPAGPALLAGIRNSIWEYEAKKSRRNEWARRLVPVAAAVVLGLGGLIAYQLGHLRLTTESQDSYLRAVTSRVSLFFRVGLSDHIHCSVFQKFDKNPPPIEKVAEELGPEFKELPALVKAQLPADLKIVLAHECGYGDRDFIHLSAQGGGELMSLVIARRADGESFDVKAALTHEGIPVYRTSAQRFEVAAFQTDKHLVYVVSDMPEERNTQLLMALAPSLKSYLATRG